MPQENVVLYNPMDELDEDLNINIEKLWKTIWSRRVLLIKIFCSDFADFHNAKKIQSNGWLIHK